MTAVEATIGRDGSVRIPSAICEAAGIDPGDRLHVAAAGEGRVVLSAHGTHEPLEIDVDALRRRVRDS